MSQLFFYGEVRKVGFAFAKNENIQEIIISIYYKTYFQFV